MPDATATGARSRQIWLGVGAPILGLVLAILIAAFWLFSDVAKRQDRDFVTNSGALVTSAIAGRTQALANTTIDYAYWNDAFNAISVKWNEAWLDANYYSSVADGMIVFGGGRVRHVWFDDTPEQQANAIAEAILDATTETELQIAASTNETHSINRFAVVDNHLIGLSIAPIALESEVRRRASRATQDYVASVEIFTPEELAERGAALGLHDMIFQESFTPAADLVSRPVIGRSGRIVGHLTWRNERPGSADFAGRVWPITIGLLLIGALAMFVARRMVANQVAVLARAEAALESSRAKSEFIATMSHELRTPLNAIIGYGELIGEQVSTGDENEKDIRADSGRIVRSAQHLLGLINNILDHARLDAGVWKIASTPIGTSQILSEIDDIVRPLAVARGNTLSFSTETNADWVLGDPARLRQCLLNLVGNAIKFTSKGAVNVSVRSGNDGAERCILFEVADTGIGIGPEAQSRIFAPFVQADSSISRLYGGSGLGLSIARKAARAMGGDILFSSTPGEGSVFTLRMPASPAALMLAA
ncbi:MAG: ATP-binding protein [Terricaulis sp.]